MSNKMNANSNVPLWNPALNDARTPGPFYEVWYLKLNDPTAQNALWIRFTLLISANGFKRVAETWAVLFQRNPATKEVTRTAVKQTYDLRSFSSEGGVVKIGESEFSNRHARGSILSKGRNFSWDLTFSPRQDLTFNLVPEMLHKTGLTKTTAFTLGEDLNFSGSCQIDGQAFTWKDCPGSQAHLSGSQLATSWVWGQCNVFANEEGAHVPFVFEGLSARAPIFGPFPSPKLSTFYFRYKEKDYFFNSLWEAIHIRSRSDLTEWHFQADRGDISFRGQAKAQYKDFAGITYEDTDGSFAYCANTKLSDMKIYVYRRGKMETSVHATGTAAFEIVSRTKNPYVPLLV